MERNETTVSFYKYIKPLILLLSLLIILTGMAGVSLAYIVTGTPTINNLFVSGVAPTGNLVIRKQIEHPFGNGYVVPDNANTTFSFNVNLGTGNANRSFGDYAADEKGMITLSIKAGGSALLTDIPVGTTVIVTEQSKNIGFAGKETIKEVTVQQDIVNSVDFVNVYSPAQAPVDLAITGTKTLIGRDWQEGDSFTFRLEQNINDNWINLGEKYITCHYIEQENHGEQMLVPEQNFNQFDFTDLIGGVCMDAAGIYSFRVTEVEGTIGGIVYDKAESCFDVLVGDADMDGALEIQKVFSNSTNTSVDDKAIHINFENRYAPAGSAEAVIQIHKNLNDTSGQNMTPDGYTFSLYDENNQLLKTSEATNAVGETSINLVYEPSDAGKTFTYILKEDSAEIPGVNFDSSEYKIQVTVIDNLDGTVSAYVYNYAGRIPEQPEEKIPAENPKEIPEEEMPAENPEEIPEEEMPAENLEEIPEEEMPAENREETSEEEIAAENSDKQNEAEQKKIVDTEPQARINAIEYVGYPVKKTVVPYVPDGATNTYKADFTNIYAPRDAVVTISGIKELTGRILQPGEFTFELYQTEEDFLISDAAKPAATAVNSPEGSFSFEALSFEKVGIYYYVVMENDSDAMKGIQYDKAKFFITVHVTDEGGVLSAQTDITDEFGTVCEILFKNSYSAADAVISLNGSKTLTGRKLETGEFTFDLYQTTESFSVDGAAIQSVNNQADGKFSFDNLVFNDIGTWYYVVRENASSPIEGVLYDYGEYHITVSVADNSEGALIPSLSMKKVNGNDETAAEKICFENHYAFSNTAITVSGEKILHGATLKEGLFNFLLYRADDGFNPQGEAIRSAMNKSDGSFTFDALTYESAGTYYYIMTEDNSKPLQGYVYDDVLYHVTVKVTEDSSGKLSASQTIAKADGSEVDKAVFVNTYIADMADTSFDITVKKLVNNTGSKTIGPEGFDFTLTNIDTGKKITVTSDKGGLAVITLNFTQADVNQTFRYTLAEDAGQQEGVTYSDTVYQFEIAVTTNDEGNLVAALVRDGEKAEYFIAEFVNTYTAGINTGTTGTRTGDTGNPMLWLALMFVSLIMIFGAYSGIRRKKRRNREV